MNYLVTGATGFVGSHVIDEILSHPKNKVFALVRKNSFLWRINTSHPNLQLIETDFRDIQILIMRLKYFTPLNFIHLAWAGVEKSHRDDAIQLYNLKITQFVFNLAKQLSATSFTSIGSQAEYQFSKQPIKETSPLAPITLYARTKVNTYKFLKQSCGMHSIQLKWIRLFPCFGPRDNPSYLIPYVIRSFLLNTPPLLTDGYQKWDYSYIGFVAKIIYRISNSNKAGLFNLGSGKAYSIRDLVEYIYSIMQPSVEPYYGYHKHIMEQTYLVADTESIKEFVNSSDENDILNSLKITIDWYKSNPQLVP